MPKDARLFRVSVTQDHIDGGRPACGKECPLYLAIRAAGFDALHVGLSCVVWRWAEGGGVASRTPLPNNAKRFLWDFDQLGPKTVQPFSFDLEVPT